MKEKKLKRILRINYHSTLVFFAVIEKNTYESFVPVGKKDINLKKFISIPFNVALHDLSIPFSWKTIFYLLFRHFCMQLDE
jgi:hypothetical protein